ncbi:MAG: septum formation initiator family protein [Syntrophales bacterium]|nr:septum formation initiator family protein [Syntrophales bacterium]
MKIGRYVILIIIVILLFIVFGERGLIDNYAMHKKLQEIQTTNDTIRKENVELQRYVELLRDDLSTIEMVARYELGFVKKGEVVYRFLR